MEILTGYPERLPLHRAFYLGPQARPYPVESVRFHQGAALIKLASCDDRNAAEALRGLLVQIPLEDAVPLEEGEYYYFQAVGVEVFTDRGEFLGRVVEVMETGANDAYVVQGPHGEVLIPAVEDVVRELGPDRPPDGHLPPAGVAGNGARSTGSAPIKPLCFA